MAEISSPELTCVCVDSYSVSVPPRFAAVTLFFLTGILPNVQVSTQLRSILLAPSGAKGVSEAVEHKASAVVRLHLNTHVPLTQ